MAEEQWAGINIQLSEGNISIKYSDMSLRQLITLLDGAIDEIPWFREAVEIVINKNRPQMQKAEKATFVYNLRLFRHSKELNTHELSDRLNFEFNRISIIESNPNIRIQPEEINAIAKFFDVDPHLMQSVKGIVQLKK